MAVILLASTAALAATPRQIYADLAAHGKLTHHYSAADLARAAHDATAQGYGGVGVQTQRPVLQHVAGAHKTLTPSAPLSATHASGTLPFTGLQLGIFVAIALALIAGGLLLRWSGRRRSGA
jgi:crotonobetainyl-CoA:carnitine CoA-transferase CaiB-like acyl-CoA transferase